MLKVRPSGLTRPEVDTHAGGDDEDVVEEVEDLLEPVGDVEDRDAAVGQPPDDGVEQPDLVVGERGGGSVTLRRFGMGMGAVDLNGVSRIDEL